MMPENIEAIEGKIEITDMAFSGLGLQSVAANDMSQGIAPVVPIR